MHSILRTAVMAASLAVSAPAIAQTEWVAPGKPPVDVVRLEAPARIDPVQETIVRDGDEGYWVVLGSLSIEADPALWEASGRQVQANAARCGVLPFDDYSDRFIGFEPGYDVFVVGPYARKEKAAAVRVRLLDCIPDAYIKHGLYTGG